MGISLSSNRKPSQSQHAPQNLRKGCQESRQSPKEHLQGQQEEVQEKEGILRHLHLQGVEASPPRHWNLLQGHEHHELFRQRYLRTYRRRGFPFGSLQQEVHHHLSRDPNRRQAPPPRRVGQARRL